MSRIYTIKNKLVESRLFLNRIISAFALILLLTSGLIVRLVYLQIVGHEHYATLAKDNSIKIEPLVPTRGIIYDRHGKVLADNTQSFSLELIPEQIADLDDTLLRLQKLLNISDEKNRPIPETTQTAKTLRQHAFVNQHDRRRTRQICRSQALFSRR